MSRFVYGLIALSLLIGIVLNVSIVNELNNKCDDTHFDIVSAPALTAVSLSILFLSNCAWLYTDKMKRSIVKKVALFIWTVSILGLVAAGAALGQIQLYKSLCTDLSGTEFSIISYISLVLLFFSTVAPHTPQNKEALEKPLLSSTIIETPLLSSTLIENSNVFGGPIKSTTKPLAFI